MSASRYSLFSVIGLEMEYMIVDRHSLDILPICDDLLRLVSGEICADYENGAIAWSNELVLHVVELKTNGPAVPGDDHSSFFHANVTQINKLLLTHNAVLMPTGAHPWMDPIRETRIWPHEYNEIYSLYNRIFDCRGHGWSNLQSTHINLPFNGDEEFRLLHSAIRLLMPLLPALTASTPILGGEPTGFLDSRMEAYRHNQEKIPSIAGRIIPEYIESEAEYRQLVFNPIMRDIKPYDQDGILDKHFLNSRGAIARFDRGTIEIRILDLQESPAVDTAIATFIHEALKWLVREKKEQLLQSQRFSTDLLADIFLKVIRTGEQTVLTDTEYLAFWGITGKTARAIAPLERLFSNIGGELTADTRRIINRILDEGSLATRILQQCGHSPSRAKLRDVYSTLIETLAANLFFSN